MFRDIIQESLSFKFIFFLLCILPLAISTSSLVMNIIVILITLIFINIIIRNNELKILNDNFFIFLCFINFYLFLNLANSFDINNSLTRTFGFIRFIFLPFAISYVLSFKNFKYLKLILISWLSIFGLVTIDLLYEYKFDHNLIGYSNNFPGRLSGSLNSELKIGGYYFGFIFLSISTIFYFFSKKTGIFFSILFFLVSLMIGERANFIKIFFGLLLFFSFMNFFSRKIKIYILVIFVLTISFTLKTNTSLKHRFDNQFIGAILSNGLSSFYNTSPYGAHYNSAYQIIKDYPYFGIGFKNFPLVCSDKKYIDKKFTFYQMRCSTHPHQTHLDILLSVGFLGYLLFISFFIYLIFSQIKIYKKTKNIFTLSGICFVLLTFLLPLPSGSFFTSYGATIFWFNIGILMTFKNYNFKSFKRLNLSKK